MKRALIKSRAFIKAAKKCTLANPNVIHKIKKILSLFVLLFSGCAAAYW